MRPLLTLLALAALALPLSADDRPVEADDVLALIGARSGETIADVGCGRGTWTFMLAQAVGPTGKVFAVDIDAKVLEAVDERIARENVTNVQTRHSLPDDPRLRKDTLDVVFLNDVIDYVERSALAGFLSGIREALKSDGRLVIRDPNGGCDRVIAECYRAGFALVEAILPLRNAPPRSFAGGWYALKLRRAEVQPAVLPRIGEPARHRMRLHLAEECYRTGLLTRDELRAIWEASRDEPGAFDPKVDEPRELIQAAEAVGVFGKERADALRARFTK
jgi:ubiquinone/menaquinone biosynthesis C-methylase UbiE